MDNSDGGGGGGGGASSSPPPQPTIGETFINPNTIKQNE
jgi:hypothetical protein